MKGSKISSTNWYKNPFKCPFLNSLLDGMIVNERKILNKKRSVKDIWVSLTLLRILTMCLFMIRFPTINPKCTIYLLEQDQSHELVWEGHAGEGESCV